ncbi:hypothetical protein ACFPH6_49855 [Streptomyces xiangluensis]|uniref:Transposase n=1 Tax=Streptomyces xiangluensis TaxID=2665720 RepID=A0ABV8Z5Z0_9ACTN
MPQRLPSLTVCVNATGTSTNWPPRGCPSAPISRRLQLDRKTVRRYRHNNLEDLLASAGDRGAGVLDPFTDYVQDRFQAGCTSSTQLYCELLALGYGGVFRCRRFAILMRVTV